MSDFITITKLDASRRQLEMSIMMFFLEKDHVCVHTLAAASNEVLQDLLKHYHGKSTESEWLEVIKEDKRDEVRKMMRNPQNYFKHANNDPEGVLRFYYKSTKFIIFQAVEAYSKLTKKLTTKMIIFRAWFYLENPEVLTKDKDKLTLKEISKTINSKDKKQFLDLIPIIESRLLENV